MIRIGPFRENLRGVQSAWVQCSLEAAFKLADLQRLSIGWSAVRIELLQARPTQCFRCWDYGHIRGNCKASLDRQGSCFGCGSRDHVLMDYWASPVCVVCRDKGLTSAHRLGFPRCAKACGKVGI